MKQHLSVFYFIFMLHISETNNNQWDTTNVAILKFHVKIISIFLLPSHLPFYYFNLKF